MCCLTWLSVVHSAAARRPGTWRCSRPDSHGHVGINGPLGVHIPQQLEGGQRVVAQVLAAEVSGDVCTAAVIHPVEDDAFQHRAGHTVAAEGEDQIVHGRGGHAADALALGIGGHDLADHVTELVPGLRLLGDAGLLGQIPAVEDDAVLHGLGLLLIGLAENAVQVAVDLAALSGGAVQVGGQIGIGGQILGDGADDTLAGPLAEGGGGPEVGAEHVGQRVRGGPGLLLLIVVVPCDVHGLEGDVELLFDEFLDVVTAQGGLYIPVTHGNVHVFQLAAVSGAAAAVITGGRLAAAVGRLAVAAAGCQGQHHDQRQQQRDELLHVVILLNFF